MFELIYPVDPAPVLPLPTAEKPGSHTKPGSEMVPIVEENGLVIGQAAREDVHGGTGLLHPVVHLHILNWNSELFIQRRSMWKRLFPGKWDTAVGGHIDYGELLEAALFREAAEELGFSGFNPTYIKTYLWESSKERELINVFATVGNFQLDPHNYEVIEGRYWKMDEIEANIGKGIFTPNFEFEFGAIKETLLSLL